MMRNTRNGRSLLVAQLIAVTAAMGALVHSSHRIAPATSNCGNCRHSEPADGAIADELVCMHSDIRTDVYVKPEHACRHWASRGAA